MSEIVVVADLLAAPGTGDALVEAFAETISRTHEEEGCLLYALHRHPDGERVVMVEKYTGPEAVKAHRASAHFKAAGAVLGGLLAAPPEVLGLEPVPAGDPAKGTV